MLRTVKAACFTYGPRPMMAVSLNQIGVSLSFPISESLRIAVVGYGTSGLAKFSEVRTPRWNSNDKIKIKY